MGKEAREATVVGIYHACPDEYLSLLYDVVPRERVRICRWPEGVEELVDADVVLAFKFPSARFPREELLAMPRLRWIQLASAGVDHILPLQEAGVTVTRASGIYDGAIAEYVLGLLIHVRWDVRRLLRQQSDRQWRSYKVAPLGGVVMGILGAGSVGRAIAVRAKSFDMRTLGMRRSAEPQTGFDTTVGPDGLCGLLSESDVLVVTLPRTPDTLRLIGSRELAATRPGVWLVNVSRGGVVEEPALLDALRAGHVAGAILDVFETEPLPGDSPFWELPNVLVTPHMASEFTGWPKAVAQLFCANLRRYLSGEPLAHVVDPVRGY